MNSYTPGPWRIEKTGKPSKRVCAGDECIAIVRHFDRGRNEKGEAYPSQARANAHLIASAPDLLAVCEYFIERGNYNDQMLYAVRKAKGGQSE